MSLGHIERFPKISRYFLDTIGFKNNKSVGNVKTDRTSACSDHNPNFVLIRNDTDFTCAISKWFKIVLTVFS